jgi:DNA-binding NarL/FixJ family response regulator
VQVYNTDEARKQRTIIGVYKYMQPIRIFIIDDHPLVRTGLKQLIEGEADLSVCGETARMSGSVELIKECMPDLAIIDLSLPDGNGLDLVKCLKTQLPDIPVLVSSMHDEKLFAERALLTGAKGYINKQEAGEQVIDAIRRILNGEVYIGQELQAHLDMQATGATRSTTGTRIELLTNRELQIFEFIGQGLGTSKIADKLHLSVKTIETHRANIKKKLGLSSSNELMRSAVQWSLEAH